MLRRFAFVLFAALSCLAAGRLLASPVRDGADPQVKRLVHDLKAGKPNVRFMAARSLGKIGPGASSAIPALILALKDPDEIVRANASHALDQIGPAPTAQVPALVTLLKDHDDMVRMSASRSLGAIGAAASPAVPALGAELKDPVFVVRANAAVALGRIASALPASTKGGSPDSVRETVSRLKSIRKSLTNTCPKERKYRAGWDIALKSVAEALESMEGGEHRRSR